MEIVQEAIEAYCEKISEEEPAILQEINRETHAKVLKPRMLSGHFQGRVLSLIANLINPMCILEIGTYTGYSAICLAEGLHPDGKLITIEVDEELEATIKSNISKAGLESKIHLKIGKALEIIESLDETFDIVFIDADKLNYELYYDAVFDKVASGGLILSDNVLWSGKVIEKETNDKTTELLRKFNLKLKNDPRTQKVLLPIRDGLFVSRKL
jgi:caffeoyl-CoA O-methyltransferase